MVDSKFLHQLHVHGECKIFTEGDICIYICRRVCVEAKGYYAIIINKKTDVI